ncbi:MAG: 23S rRNA (pseudouridine(1915)-N(3))-methyltransferase RlmH [Proteobacteria bacterium]|nr:23S rRNA (pseudouridine(1915)-N(3))-methyltransferase RlmH [Pseudomonadota bacterium]
MPKIILLTGGSIKNTPEALLYQEYQKRIHYPITLVELKNKKEMQESFDKYKSQTPSWIAMDEKGINLTSINFSKMIQQNFETFNTIGFIIGIDTGIDDAIKQQCIQKISFGAQTWPHLLARVLLIEQLYRAQQIIQNHPYHKV